MGISDAGESFWSEEEETDAWDTALEEGDLTDVERETYDTEDYQLTDDEVMDEDTAATDWGGDYIEQHDDVGDMVILPNDYYEDEFWEEDVYEKADDPDWNWKKALNRDFSDEDTKAFLSYMEDDEDEGVMAFLKNLANNKGLLDILVKAGLGGLAAYRSDRAKTKVSRGGGGGGGGKPAPVSALGGQMGRVIKGGGK